LPPILPLLSGFSTIPYTTARAGSPPAGASAGSVGFHANHGARSASESAYAAPQRPEHGPREADTEHLQGHFRRKEQVGEDNVRERAGQRREQRRSRHVLGCPVAPESPAADSNSRITCDISH